MRRQLDFIGKRKIWFWLSGLLLVLALVSLLVRGLNLGIDFTGGLELDARFHRPVTSAQVRAVLDAAGVRQSEVQLVGSSGREVFVKMPALSERERLRAEGLLARRLGPFTTVSLDKVTGVVSGELVRNGILEVLLASGLIILYMTLRFDFRFALSGILAVFYDALVSIGLVALIHIQITEAFIPAVLTIVGYSINDRIIIFDRIRENLRTMSRSSLAEITNTSLNQTLGRSINTAVIVILAMLAILVFGGQSTRDFAATTVIGVFFGAYSSIFVASPVWVTWVEKVQGKGAPSPAASSAVAAVPGGDVPATRPSRPRRRRPRRSGTGR